MVKWTTCAINFFVNTSVYEFSEVVFQPFEMGHFYELPRYYIYLCMKHKEIILYMANTVRVSFDHLIC